MEKPQTVGASVSGAGTLALAGGTFSFAGATALSWFSGLVDLTDAVLNVPMVGEYANLGGSTVRMRGAEMYLGTANGTYLTNSVDVALGTSNLIRSRQSNIFVRGGITGAGTLTVRTDGGRGPRLDCDASGFRGTIVMRNVSGQADSGFRVASSVNENAKLVVESDNRDRVYDIAGGGTYRFGALRQADDTTDLRVVSAGTQIEIGARDGETSVLNGQFTRNKVTLTKVGATSTLMLGPGFAAVDGTRIDVKAGQLGFTFDAYGERVASLANCEFSVDEGAYLRLDMKSSDLASLALDREYPVAILPTALGDIRSAVYVDGEVTDGTDADSWRLACVQKDGFATLVLKHLAGERAEDGSGNVFTLPAGWRKGFPAGVMPSTIVSGEGYTYAQT